PIQSNRVARRLLCCRRCKAPVAGFTPLRSPNAAITAEKSNRPDRSLIKSFETTLSQSPCSPLAYRQLVYRQEEVVLTTPQRMSANPGNSPVTHPNRSQRLL